MGVAPDPAVEEILSEGVKTSGISKATGDAPRTVR
jgi:hypothetical protein